MKATKALVAATAGIFLLSACSEDVQWSDPEITENNDIVEADDTADEAAGTTEDITSGADNGLSVAGGSAEESSGGFFDDLSAELEDWWNEDTTGSEDLTQPDNLGTDDSWEEYDRDAFPHWKDTDGNGCDARNDVLARDLTTFDVEGDGCTVTEGVLDDPFTGEIIYFQRGGAVSKEEFGSNGEYRYTGGGSYENAIDIDHIVPLSYAAKNGNAMSWDAETREQFANDPANLIAVDPSSNRSKGDSGPADWLVPDNASYQCEYATQFENVADAYGIELPTADAQAIAAAC